MKMWVLVALMFTAGCGNPAQPAQPDIGSGDGSGGADYGTWKTECFPDAGMCRAYRWQHEIVSASCEHGKGCRCSLGLGDGAVTITCPLPADFSPSIDAGLAAMLGCCFKGP